MPRINLPVDGRRKHHTRAFLQSDEAVAPGWIVRRQAGRGNCDQAAALSETPKRRRNVPQRGVGDAAVDVGCDRKRGVHQHDGRTCGRVEMVVDMSRVVAGDSGGGEQAVEQTRPRVGELVEDQAGA